MSADAQTLLLLLPWLPLLVTLLQLYRCLAFCCHVLQQVCSELCNCRQTLCGGLPRRPACIHNMFLKHCS